MADDTLELLIKMTADTSGAKEAIAANQEVGSSVKQSGQAHEEANQHVQKHLVSHRALHKVFHALNEILPGLGSLMQAAFSPVAAAIGLAVMALRSFHEHIKQVNEEFKRIEEEAAKPLTNRLEAMREATIESAVGLEALREKLAQAARGEQGFKEQIEQAIQLQKLQGEVAQATGEALHGAEMARLDAIHSAGIISEEQYALRKLQIEADYQQKKRHLQEQAEVQEIMMRQRTLDLAEASQPELAKAAEEAERKKVKANADLRSLPSEERVRERMTSAKSDLGAFEANAGKAAVSWYEQAGSNMTASQFMAFATKKMDDEHLSQAQVPNIASYTEWADKVNTYTREKGLYDRLPGARASAEVAASKATHEAEQAERLAEANEDYVTRGNQDLGLKRLEHRARHESNQGIDAAESAANAYREEGILAGSRTGQVIKQGADAFDAVAHGRQLSTAQQAQLAAVENLLNGQHLNSQAVLQALERLHGNDAAFIAQIAALTKRIEDQGAQIAGIMSRPPNT